MSEILTPVVMVAGTAVLYRVTLLCTDAECPAWLSVPAVVAAFAMTYFLMKAAINA